MSVEVQQNVNGVDVQLRSDKGIGYNVVILRKDGTIDRKEVGSAHEGRTVMGDIVNGRFTTHKNCGICGERFRLVRPADARCPDHQAR